MSTAPPASSPVRASAAANAGSADAIDLAARPEATLVAETKNEIRVLVQEIAQLASSDLGQDEFYAQFLGRVVSAMGAVGGAVWTVGESARLKLQYQVNLAQTLADPSPEARTQHGLLLKQTLSGNQALLIPPQAGAGAPSEAGNPTKALLVLAPLIVEGEARAVVEIFQRAGGGPTTQRGYLRFLIQMCDIACDYLRNRQLRQLQENQSLWQQLEQFVQAVHRSLNVRATSYGIVNEGRRLAACDRVSLALMCGRRCRIEAVSGLDTIDRRASEVKRLQELAEAVLRTGEPLWHTSETETGDTPPQIEKPLHQYLDLSHARLVAVLPLFAPSAKESDAAEAVDKKRRPIGALILEQIRDAKAGESLRSRAQLVAQHSATALSNSINHSSLFLLPLWQVLGKATWLVRGYALPRALLVLAIVVGAVAALTMVQTDFEVAARGKLQPQERRDVFAQIDGIVARVHVRHGQSVKTGMVLTELTNTNLEMELAALVGRQTTNQEQLASHQRALLDTTGGSGARLSAADESRLSGELLQLRQEAENITREIALFQEKQRQLTVVADRPGQVITWKVEDLLTGRPVQRGQSLMSVANPAGAWELELYIPERRLKHIQAALEQEATEGERAPLDVVFTLTSHPGQQFHGRIVEMEQAAEVRPDEGNTVLARVEIDKDQLPPLHDQTTVTAKLYVGRTSVGHAWFCDLIETIQTKVLFWLPTKS